MIEFLRTNVCNDIFKIENKKIFNAQFKKRL
jgi:hypothetical protein